MILSFSDSDEYIMDKVKAVIEKEAAVQYIDTEPVGVLSFPDLEICLKEQVVYRCGRPVPMSCQEFSLLSFLAGHPGWVFSKTQIYEAVYGDEVVESIDNSIYCLIRSLRKKIETDPSHPVYIQTVRGAGYRFTVPEE